MKTDQHDDDDDDNDDDDEGGGLGHKKVTQRETSVNFKSKILFCKLDALLSLSMN